jgi:uncharacterized protein (TIGR02147 family)
MDTLNIFEYSDYRQYLKDYYELHKSLDPQFTYRYIAGRVGFKSAGHFTQILKGFINLSSSMAASFIDFLKLNKREAGYFDLLVRFDQAKTHAEKRRYFERMTEFRELKIVTLDPSQYEYYDKWYYVAVREVLSYCPFKGDYAALAKKVKPSISQSEAKKAIMLLERLGLIKKGGDGIYKKTAAAVSAAPLGGSIAITNQALQTMRLAQESLDRFPKEWRNISGVAFTVSQKTFEGIQEEIRNFRKRILDLAQDDSHPDAVYQFNVQLFPLSALPEKKEEQP